MKFSLQNLRAELKALASQPGPRYVIFKSDWCPDCVRAVPPAKKAFQTAGISSILIVDVGSREEWKNKETLHPLRTDPELRINGIPTIITLTTDGHPGSIRLGSELEAASTEEEASMLVSSFIDTTRNNGA